MYSPNPLEPEMGESGGETLEGSGFEGENPEPGFESNERSALEGLLQ